MPAGNSTISLHGGGSPEAMKREIWRNYPVTEKVELVETARLEATRPLLHHRLRGSDIAGSGGTGKRARRVARMERSGMRGKRIRG
jgi:hypothetical protein